MWWSVSESQALLLWSVHQGLLSDPKPCKACMYPILSVLRCFWDFRLFCGWFTEEGKWPNLLGIFQVLHSDKRKEGEKTRHWQGSKLLRHLSPSFLHGSVFPPFVIWFYFFFSVRSPLFTISLPAQAVQYFSLYRWVFSFIFQSKHFPLVLAPCSCNFRGLFYVCVGLDGFPKLWM